MKIEQQKWSAQNGWTSARGESLGNSAQLVLVFSARSVLRQASTVQSLQGMYPSALVLGCSTAGEICGTQVSDETMVATAVWFEHTQLQWATVNLREAVTSFRAGELLAQALPGSVASNNGHGDDGLVHVLVFSDGLKVNGSDLVAGLTKHLPPGTTLTGGLAGDGARFEETLVFSKNGPESDTVAVLGLYGTRLKVGFGSLGGWDSFGPERIITRSKGNVLFELDGRSALGLYKKYLGEHARELPASGLLFPLSLRTKAGETAVVRTILSIDEKAESMTFAGDVPEGAYARLMKANFDRLIDGATGAAQRCHQALASSSSDLAILISCVGRKLVLKQRIEEEVEAVRDVLGERTALTGFYSYGEISPFTPGARCELHNQTMTVTTLSEG
jgi:hypothetical protein